MSTPWEILDSSITYQDRWLKVRSDRCRTGRGVIVEPFHVIEYPTWVCVVALTEAFDVVLSREYRHGVQQVLTGLPSGAMDAEDPSPLHAIRRELTEETGYQAGEFVEVGATFASPSSLSNKVHCFLAFDVRPTGERALDESEDIEVVTMPFLEFLRLTDAGEGELHGLQVAGLHFAIQHLLREREPRRAPLRQALLAHLTGEG